MDKKRHSRRIRQGKLLSERQNEVVDLIIDGHTNLSISMNLGISEETVKRHLFNIFDKTGHRSRLDLAVSTLKERHAAEIAAVRSNLEPFDFNSN